MKPIKATSQTVTVGAVAPAQTVRRFQPSLRWISHGRSCRRSGVGGQRRARRVVLRVRGFARGSGPARAWSSDGLVGVLDGPADQFFVV